MNPTTLQRKIISAVFPFFRSLAKAHDHSECWNIHAHITAGALNCPLISCSILPSLAKVPRYLNSFTQPRWSDPLFSSREPGPQPSDSTASNSLQSPTPVCAQGYSLIKPIEPHHLQRIKNISEFAPTCCNFLLFSNQPYYVGNSLSSGCMGDNHYSEPFSFVGQLADSHYKRSQIQFFSTSSNTGNSNFLHLQNLSLLVMQCLSDHAHSQEVRYKQKY